MISGVVIVRKETGMTSFGVVSRLRRIFNQKKIGHTGTLDPDAEGVLPVCLGRATRLVEELSRGTKTYRTVLLLGRETDTQDFSGRILREGAVTVTEEEVRAAILSFAGRQMQLPPMYSALKVDGKKLVDLARRGIEVERQMREVEFSEIRIHDIRLPEVDFEVTCSHGTYIRTLCHDIGRKLGCGGCMKALVRTRVESFHLEAAWTLRELEEEKRRADEEGVYPYPFVLPVDSFYSDCPAIEVREAGLSPVLNGSPAAMSALVSRGDESPEPSDLQMGSRARLYAPDGSFIGLYERGKRGMELVKYYYEGRGD